ncbi:MAG: NAD(P)H-dependent flavin oxidoreductase [bacterium]
MTVKLPSLTIGKHTSKYPIIQGGMGIRVSASRLAGAVATAGGIGVIATVGLCLNSSLWDGKRETYFEANKQALIEELRTARKKSPDGIIGTNCMVAISDFELAARTSAENGADLIISGAGLPLSLPEYVAGYPDVALVPIVSSTKAAELIIKRWERRYSRLPDALVVESPNTAGGHLGAKFEEVQDSRYSHHQVIPQLLEMIENQFKVKIPVIIAGGVWNNEDLVQMLELGAAGVQIATRLISTYECDADQRFKDLLRKATQDDIVLINSPVGFPGRVIRNPFVERFLKGEKIPDRCIANCLRRCSFKKEGKGFCIAQALDRAQKGDVERGLFFSGSNGFKEQKMASVQEIINDLAGKKDNV